ncbi:hypothetical protein AYY22_19435 [Photobacterium kishitanii]|nr:hypothetical protein AYY22_19435 [Photobacterium kishitanii]
MPPTATALSEPLRWERGALCSYQLKPSIVFFDKWRKFVCSAVIWANWANHKLISDLSAINDQNCDATRFYFMLKQIKNKPARGWLILFTHRYLNDN